MRFPRPLLLLVLTAVLLWTTGCAHRRMAERRTHHLASTGMECRAPTPCCAPLP